MKYLISSFLLVLLISCSSSDGDSDTTPPPPSNTLASVSVVSATNILENSATSGGNVTSNGGANVTAKGVCWSTNTNPTINDNKTSNGNGIGTFTSELTGLNPNTLYYVRAYATNSEGTAYSSGISFTTEEEPVQCGNVLSTGIELKTQTEVDNLGAQGINIINGNLMFDGLSGANSDPIIDLSSLSCLQEVNGFILFDNLENVETLEGFENLDYTQGLVFQTTNISSLDALSSLEIVDGNVIISRNNMLTNLNGLNGITSILGTLQIISNDELTNAEGLESLQSVGEELWIYDNPKLPNIEGLNNLTQVGGKLYITDNNILTNIEALSNLETLSAINIENNPMLESISAFSNLTVLTIERLIIKQNSALVSLLGLENINIITDFVEIRYNDVMINVDGLNNIETIGNYLTISDNNLFSDLDGLSNLVSVGGELTIRSDSGTLTNVCGLQPLLVANGLEGAFSIFIEGFDVTEQDIIDGNCSQ